MNSRWSWVKDAAIKRGEIVGKKQRRLDFFFFVCVGQGRGGEGVECPMDDDHKKGHG